MKFFLDGSDIGKIKKFSDLGLIDGVTTNPSIILKSGKNMIEVISELASIVSGSISAEVSALDSEKMVKEGIKAFADSRKRHCKTTNYLEWIRSMQYFISKGHKR